MKRGLLLVGALVVVVAAAASAFFLLAPSGPREIRLEAREFGFNGPSGGPTIRAKVGETIRIVLVNMGGADHEFMVVSDKDGFLQRLHQVIAELRAKGLDEEKIETSEEVEEVHHHFTAVELTVGNERKMDVEVEPRESATFTLRFDRPGTYYYLCADMGLTFPEVHADRGMWGTIVVEG